MKTIVSIRFVWTAAIVAAALLLAGQNAVAAPAEQAGAVTPPTVTGGDVDQVDNADQTADIRTPQVVDPDIRDVDVPDVEAPDVHVPDVEVPDVHVPDVEVPETN
ncbi:MAG TPA: hypothetical protein VNH42_06610 [Mariprofundaceae bacterium]|nr:hypothetical protein [Mariprofundaceae bacterium]